MLYLDQPYGTGFSFASSNTSAGVVHNETQLRNAAAAAFADRRLLAAAPTPLLPLPLGVGDKKQFSSSLMLLVNLYASCACLSRLAAVALAWSACVAKLDGDMLDKVQARAGALAARAGEGGTANSRDLACCLASWRTATDPNARSRRPWPAHRRGAWMAHLGWWAELRPAAMGGQAGRHMTAHSSGQ